MPKNSIQSSFFLLSLFILINAISLIRTAEKPKIIVINFNTKDNLEDELEDEDMPDIPYLDPDDDYEDEDDDPMPYFPVVTPYNVSAYLNEYFYSGIYTDLSHSSKKSVHSLISFDDSKLSLTKCLSEKVESINSIKYSSNYLPKNSASFQKKNNVGSDEFSLALDFSLSNRVNKTLDFIYQEDNSEFYCGNLGLNLNKDDTNLVKQLKSKSAIDKNIWTLEYQLNTNGILVFGDEPHFYKNNSYFRSQYRKIYSDSKDSWAMKFTDIYLNTNDSKKINLNNDKVEIKIDHGLIIGTQSYKNELDKLYFDKLIADGICYRNKTKLNFGDKDEYFVYYCHKSRFMGDAEYSTNPKYAFFGFPDLVFNLQNYNKTFVLDKHDLFVVKRNKFLYFLVAFKVNENKVWKLGEPFLYKNRILVFDQDKKMIGFYNSNLPKIFNNEYNVTVDEFGNPITDLPEADGSHSTFFYVMSVGGIIILVGVLIVLAYLFGKKLNEQKKKRANELGEDEFDYNKDNALYKNENP